MADGVLSRRIPLPCLQIPLGITNVTLDISWLITTPAVIWALITIYIPILGPGLSGFQAWVVTLAILLCILLSLTFHASSHIIMARALGYNIPARIPIHLLGDIAQVWPTAPSALGEALLSVSGLMAQGILMGIAYFLWNGQFNQTLSVIAFFVLFFNLGLVAINLTPAFPFDGGRLVRSVTWWLLGTPEPATIQMFRLGFLVSLALMIWSVFLFTQQTRLSLETSAATFILAGLILLSLIMYWRWKTPGLQHLYQFRFPAKVLRVTTSLLFVILLATVTCSLIPLNYGLEAPGFTASVEPMVKVPPQYRHSHVGNFIISSVILQAPILAGEWAYGHLDNSIKLVPQEKIVPITTSVQSVARASYQMLLDSETTAAVAGLRLAGYPVDIRGKGARVISILPQGSASDLRLGDVITAINGVTITSPADLNRQLSLLEKGDFFQLLIERNGKVTELSGILTAPSSWDEPSRLGINAGDNGYNVQLPFPVEIIHQKTDGGPSSGLMFALGVCNTVSLRDLTGGRKIAGTGTIDLDGRVGPVGGVQQKVVAAERAGAQYFLCPEWNYQDALTYAKQIQVVKVNTIQEARDFLNSLPPLIQS